MIFTDDDLKRFSGSGGTTYGTNTGNVVSKLATAVDSMGAGGGSPVTPIKTSPSDRELYLQSKFDELLGSIKPGIKRARAQALLGAAGEVGKEVSGMREARLKEAGLSSDVSAKAAGLDIQRAGLGMEAGKSILGHILGERRLAADETAEGNKLRYLMDKLGIDTREMLSRERLAEKGIELEGTKLDIAKKVPLFQLLNTMVEGAGKSERGFTEMMGQILQSGKASDEQKSKLMEAVKELEKSRSGLSMDSMTEYLKRLGLDEDNPLGL